MSKQRVTHTIVDRLGSGWGREGFVAELKFLREQESGGWELVSILRYDLVGAAGVNTYFRYFFKRPFPETPS